MILCYHFYLALFEDGFPLMEVQNVDELNVEMIYEILCTHLSTKPYMKHYWGMTITPFNTGLYISLHFPPVFSW